MVILVCSQSPGPMAMGAVEFPLAAGYSKLFGTKSRLLQLFSFPPLLLMNIGSLYASSRIVFSMARSGLYSPIFGRLSSLGSPCASLFTCCSLSALSTFLAWKLGCIDFFSLVSAAQVAGAFSYMSSFVSFIIFRLNFPDLERQYVSIVGIPGAVVGILLCVLVIVCIFASTREQAAFVYSFIGSVLVIASTYYVFVAKNRQRFSDQERDILFTAHLMKGMLKLCFQN